jgi:hypothetical protein
MKKKMVIIAASGILFFLFFLNACTKQNEETLMQESGIQPCDSSNMSYATDIQPILEFNCVSCHNSSISNLGVILTDYNDILIQVNNGNLINVIEHNPGYPQMPFGLPQLPTCTINKILAWVNRGAPNN